MLDHEISIAIPGRAAPKGSMTCIGRRGRVAHVLIEDDTSGRRTEWRATVSGWAAKKWPDGQRAGKGQPVGVEATVTLPRPKSHYGTGRNSSRVKPSAPLFPVSHSTGDVDKHTRQLLDALQDAEVIPDDCAVVETTIRKAYVDGPQLVPDALGYPGVLIRVFPYDPAGVP